MFDPFARFLRCNNQYVLPRSALALDPKCRGPRITRPRRSPPTIIQPPLIPAGIANCLPTDWNPPCPPCRRPFRRRKCKTILKFDHLKSRFVSTSPNQFSRKHGGGYIKQPRWVTAYKYGYRRRRYPKYPYGRRRLRLAYIGDVLRDEFGYERIRDPWGASSYRFRDYDGFVTPRTSQGSFGRIYTGNNRVTFRPLRSYRYSYQNDFYRRLPRMYRRPRIYRRPRRIRTFGYHRPDFRPVNPYPRYRRPVVFSRSYQHNSPRKFIHKDKFEASSYTKFKGRKNPNIIFAPDHTSYRTQLYGRNGIRGNSQNLRNEITMLKRDLKAQKQLDKALRKWRRGSNVIVYPSQSFNSPESLHRIRSRGGMNSDLENRRGIEVQRKVKRRKGRFIFSDPGLREKITSKEIVKVYDNLHFPRRAGRYRRFQTVGCQCGLENQLFSSILRHPEPIYKPSLAQSLRSTSSIAGRRLRENLLGRPYPRRIYRRRVPTRTIILTNPRRPTIIFKPRIQNIPRRRIVRFYPNPSRNIFKFQRLNPCRPNIITRPRPRLEIVEHPRSRSNIIIRSIPRSRIIIRPNFRAITYNEARDISPMNLANRQFVKIITPRVLTPVSSYVSTSTSTQEMKDNLVSTTSEERSASEIYNSSQESSDKCSCCCSGSESVQYGSMQDQNYDENQWEDLSNNEDSMSCKNI